MKTNVELTIESEDTLDKFAKMSRPKRYKKKDDKINAALKCLDRFLTYLDEETISQVGFFDNEGTVTKQ